MSFKLQIHMLLTKASKKPVFNANLCFNYTWQGTPNFERPSAPRNHNPDLSKMILSKLKLQK